MRDLIRECFQTKADVKKAAIEFIGISAFLVCAYLGLIAIYAIAR